MNARCQFNDPEIQSCIERADRIFSQNLQQKLLYHTECYKLITHTLNLQRLKERYGPSITVNEQDPNKPHDESCSQLSKELVKELFWKNTSIKN